LRPVDPVGGVLENGVAVDAVRSDYSLEGVELVGALVVVAHAIPGDDLGEGGVERINPQVTSLDLGGEGIQLLGVGGGAVPDLSTTGRAGVHIAPEGGDGRPEEVTGRGGVVGDQLPIE